MKQEPLAAILIITSSLNLAIIEGRPSPYPPSPVVVDVEFDWSSHIRLASGSDNWPMTWADDDHQYTVWGDGGGFGGTNKIGRSSMGVARIEGGWHDFTPVNVWGGHKAANAHDQIGKSYGNAPREFQPV